MYFHLSNHIFAAFFKDECIVLDIKKDNYFLLDKEKSNLLQDLLKHPWTHLSEESYTAINSAQDSDLDLGTMYSFITLLKRNNWIDGNLHEKAYPCIPDNKATGAEEIDWRLPLKDNIKTRLSWAVLKAFVTLTKVHWMIKISGFYRLINWIQKAGNSKRSFIHPTIDQMEALVNTLNQACLLYPKRTKCLEWASTLTLLSLQRGWLCTLNIGAQNYPFLSHAWAEVNGTVIADKQILKNEMAVMLKAPFQNGD
jgi:hypothetical protein